MVFNRETGLVLSDFVYHIRIYIALFLLSYFSFCKTGKKRKYKTNNLENSPGPGWPEPEALAEHSVSFLLSLQRVMVPRTLQNTNNSMHKINAVLKSGVERARKNSPPNYMYQAPQVV